MKTIISCVFFLSFVLVKAEQPTQKFFELMDLGLFELAKKQASLTNVESELMLYYDILAKGKFPEVLNETSDYPTAFNIQLLIKGITQYAKYGFEEKAINLLNESLNLAKNRNDNVLVCVSIRYILEVYERFHTVINDHSYMDYIEQLKLYSYNNQQRITARLFEYRIGQRYNYEDINFIYNNYRRHQPFLEKELKSPLLKVKRDLTHFVHHQNYTKNLDSSLFYLNRVFKILDTKRGYLEEERWLAAKINQASLYLMKERPRLALETLTSIKLVNSDYLYELLKGYKIDKESQAYKKIGDSLNYYKSLSNAYFFDLKINQGTNAQKVSDLATKYQTAEKEKQILEEQQKVRTNRNWLIAACLAFIFGAGIAVLLQKNTSKKRLLAEQEALLKQERVDNLLKEQELVSIDAMIAGQEKERQRVANELHDDLGSLMATIKLHFDNAKISKKDPGLQNAQKLLEEAYQKVRSMAHSKNSGVMSDQGLLPAIKKIAQVITETNALEVTVEAFGMGERLENSLELNLFRMVQELVANAIKHAEASKVSIQLTQHEDNLNIIIEDNGKGFDRSKVDASKTGMGLTTIEKRVEHLEGNFTVDSVLGKGTSILIDIPV